MSRTPFEILYNEGKFDGGIEQAFNLGLGHAEHERLVEFVELYSALSEAHGAMNRALTLGCIDEASTRRIVIASIKKIEMILPEPGGGKFVGEEEENGN